MAVSRTFTDSEGKTWDFGAVNPIGSRFPSQSGQGVVNGTADAYDGGFALAIGTDLTGFGNATLVNPGFGSVDEAGRELNLRPVLVGGIAVSRSFLVSDTAISAIGFARLLDSFTNTTDQTVTIRVQLISDLGSDGATAVVEETSGNDAIDPDDRGFVTDEITNQTGGDSAVGFVYGDGFGLASTEARPALVSGEGVDEISVVFDLTLAPGETQRLLSFAFQNTTAALGAADLTQFDDRLITLADRGLLAGISAAERAQIVNYTETGNLVETRVVTDGTGQEWSLGLNGATLIALGTDALRGTDFELGGSLLDSFRTLVGDVVSEAGQEATLTFATTNPALGAATIATSVMASPVDNFARMLVTITAGAVALDFEGQILGLIAGVTGDTLVGDRDLATGAADGVAAITDSGAVLDDSDSGAGGTDPALTIVFGDFSLGKPVEGATDEVQLSEGLLRATDGDLFVAANTSQSFLFFFSLNSDAGPGLADLARLSTPDAAALAGLSAAEVAQIQNFDLDEDDRAPVTSLGALDDQFVGNFFADRVQGGAGNDDIAGGGSDDVLFGDAGDDLLDGGISDDRLDGGDGRDVLLGGAGRDVLRGNLGDDQAFGGEGDDTAFGFRGTDTLIGGAGRDTLFGEIDDDVIEGGAGTDRVSGGPGRDTFVFNAGFGEDRVLDFRNGSDRLDFRGHTGVDAFGDLTLSQVGSSVLILDGEGGRIVLADALLAQIDAGDMLF